MDIFLHKTPHNKDDMIELNRFQIHLHIILLADITKVNSSKITSDDIEGCQDHSRKSKWNRPWQQQPSKES